jgi:hypothetical protein
MTETHPMASSHPITPPPELVQQWVAEIWHEGTPVRVSLSDEHIATRAAQWGADQELKASVSWLVENQNPRWADALYAARRPKPPSLKEQALQALSEAVKMADDVPPEGICSDQADIIRRALEALPND